MRVPEGFKRCFQETQRFAITVHISPEGDALGSALALSLGLRKLGKKTQVICHRGFPSRYVFLPHADEIRPRPSFPPQLLVLIDCADLERADIPQSFKKSRPKIAIIDHHPLREENPLAWIEPEAAATGEMVFALLNALKVPLDKDIATCLYTALITDTGVFHFRNTKPRTLRVAAKLLSLGIDPESLTDRVVESRSFHATRLLARTLQKAVFEPEFGLCWSVITCRDFARTETTDEDTENFINFLKAVEGTEIAVLFREVEPGSIKVSLRSKGRVNVAEIAGRFGGGGHRAAAGCRLSLPLPWAVRKVLRAVRQSLIGGQR